MKNKKIKSEIFKLDTDTTYNLPMIKNGVKQNIANEQRVNGVRVKQDPKRGDVTFFKEGYQSKYFVDKYVEWLLYTKYIMKD